MHIGIPVDRLAVCAIAALVAVVYARSGLCEGSLTTASTLVRYIVAGVAAVIAILVALDRIPAVVSYGLLCLAMVSVYVADLLQEEHARKRRVASLAPRPVADAAPTAWIVIAAMSPLMLTPYVVLREQLTSAFIVGVCALVMTMIAWRLASAPVQLAGEDLQLERMCDRATRSARVGNTAVLAVGIVFVFISFVNAGLPVVTPVQHILNLLSLVVWAALWAWEWWYVHRLPRPSCSASS